jgi:hypothetical protein
MNSKESSQTWSDWLLLTETQVSLKADRESKDNLYFSHLSCAYDHVDEPFECSRHFSNSEVSVLNFNHMLDSVRSANLVNCDISMVEHGRERPICREGFDIKLFPLERAKVDIRDSISLQYLLGFGTAFVDCFDIR